MLGKVSDNIFLILVHLVVVANWVEAAALWLTQANPPTYPGSLNIQAPDLSGKDRTLIGRPLQDIV